MRTLIAFLISFVFSISSNAEQITINVKVEVIQTSISSIAIGDELDVTLTYSNNIPHSYVIGTHSNNHILDNNIGSKIIVTMNNGITVTSSTASSSLVDIQSQAIDFYTGHYRYSNSFVTSQAVVSDLTSFPQIDWVALHVEEIIFTQPSTYKILWSTDLSSYKYHEFSMGNGQGQEVLAKVTNITTSAIETPLIPDLFTVNFKATVSEIEGTEAPASVGDTIFASLSYDNTLVPPQSAGNTYSDFDNTFGAGITIDLADGTSLNTYNKTNYYSPGFVSLNSNIMDFYNGVYERDMFLSSKVSQYVPFYYFGTTGTVEYDAGIEINESFNSLPVPYKENWSTNLADYNNARISLFAYHNGQNILVLADINEIWVGEAPDPTANIDISVSLDINTIAATGGTITATSSLTNSNEQTLSLSYWSYIVMPDDIHYNLSAINNTSITSLSSQISPTTISIPDYWPPGTYTLVISSMVTGTGLTQSTSTTFEKHAN